LSRGVILSFVLVAAVVFTALVSRLVQMQILQHERYAEVAERKKLRIEIVEAERGTIYDRNGVPLARDETSYDVGLLFNEFDPTFAVAKLLERETGLKNGVGFLDYISYSILSGEMATSPIDCGRPRNPNRILALMEKYPYKYDSLKLMESGDGEVNLFLLPNMLLRPLRVLALLATIVGEDFPTLLRKVERIRAKLLSIENAYQRRYEMSRPQVILKDVGRRKAFEIEVEAEVLTGVVILERRKRAYRGEPFAHIVGYMRKLNGKEVKRLRSEGRIISRAFNPPEVFDEVERCYFIDDEVGACGIEALCEERLRGSMGAQLLERDLLARRYRILQRVAPVAGEDVHLTLDASLQEAAYEALKDAGVAGAAVVMDPQTGEILALVSHPSFDPNRIRESGYYRSLLASPYPLLERASRSAFAPGSTMKIAAAVAGLAEGVIDDATKFHCRGYHKTPKAFRCWIYPGAHGDLTVSDALKHSCNTFFFSLADRMDPDRLIDWFRLLGIGSRPTSDIPSTAGLLPTPEWKRKRYEDAKAEFEELRRRGDASAERRLARLRRRLKLFRDERAWVPGDSRNLVVGQGSLLVSPLQVARMVAVVANGGFLVAPKVLLYTPIRRKRLPLDEDALSVIREGMWRAVVERGGTAFGKGLDEFGACAKTGTAEVNKKKGLNHAWIVGFAPKDEPRVVFVVFAEKVKGHGGEVAGPIAAKILSHFFRTSKVAEKRVERTSEN